jgi:hypothetical protein
MVTPKVVLLTFDSQFDITSTLLRFQEHYESPYFHGKIFSLKEFKSWYVQASPKGRETGKLTYYQDWNGFNFPSYIVTPFKEGKFDPLSGKEKKVLRLLKDLEEPYYVIGVHKASKNVDAVLDHELKHALFYINEKYREQVIWAIAKVALSTVKAMKEELMEMGYTEEVIVDEINAFVTSGSYPLQSKFPKMVKEKLVKLYEKFKEA